MPESVATDPDQRCSALEVFFQDKEAAESSKNRCQSHRRMTPSIRSGTSGLGVDHRHPKPAISHGNGRNRPQRRVAGRPSPSRHGTIETVSGSGRKPGTSQYYGVRFRPDLKKWVAEIRVAEWKAVDKKVWLGTFDTEQGAAHGVDLARKLLKCSKKHPPNLPCEKLEAYSRKIPQDLNLQDLTAQSMFKAATLFIKQECKVYASSFSDTPADPAIVPSESSPYFAVSGLHSGSSGVSNSDDVSDHVHEMILEMTSINDGLHQVQNGLERYETVATNYGGNYEVGVSTSPTGSCNSTVTTLEPLQSVPETTWAISDCHDVCCTASSSSTVTPEMIEAFSVMETTTTTTTTSPDVSAVSHQYAHDACFWPELQDPVFMSDLVHESTFFSSSMTGNGSYVAPMDFDPWFPFPGGPHYGWH